MTFDEWWSKKALPDTPDPLRELCRDAWQAALKQESAEPVAWMYEHDGQVYTENQPPVFTTRRWTSYSKESWTEIPIYTTPTAAIENFKRRVLEVIRPSQTLSVAKELQHVKDRGDGIRTALAEIIESLPLIKEK